METSAVLENAIILLETGATDCIFDALAKGAGSAWNRGFGAETKVGSFLDRGVTREAHPAYAAARTALNSLGHDGRALMCYSREASKEEKLQLLQIAKTMTIS